MSAESAGPPLARGLMHLDEALKALEPKRHDTPEIRPIVNHLHEARRRFESSLRLLDAPSETD